MAPKIEESEEEEFDDQIASEPISDDAELEEEEEEEADDDDVEDDPEDEAEDDDDDVNEEDVKDFDDFDDEEAFEPEVTRSRPSRNARPDRPVRETRKRQLTFYEEDNLEEPSDDEITPAPKKSRSRTSRPSRAKRDISDEDEIGYRPSMTRLTERQRAKLRDDDLSEKYEDLIFARMDEQLLALNAKTQKKQETAEQIAVRKAENARRRQHYKIKQLEEEKRETLNKLLKRRAGKAREADEDEASESRLLYKPRRPQPLHPALLRWVSRLDGIVLGLNE